LHHIKNINKRILKQIAVLSCAHKKINITSDANPKFDTKLLYTKELPMIFTIFKKKQQCSGGA
jgi:hypothetical protein